LSDFFQSQWLGILLGSVAEDIAKFAGNPAVSIAAVVLSVRWFV
jgi:hypothetical protein